MFLFYAEICGESHRTAFFIMGEETKNTNSHIKQKTRYNEREIISANVRFYILLHVYCDMSIKVLGFESSYLSWFK